MRPRRRYRSTEDARISEGHGTEAGLGRPLRANIRETGLVLLINEQ
jgi:hypothetical protein